MCIRDSLEPLGAQIGGEPDFLTGGLHQQRDRARAVAQLLMRLGQRRRIIENAQVVAHFVARGAQFERLGEPDRPRHQRSDGKPDQNDLHQKIGILEHTPGREILR